MEIEQFIITIKTIREQPVLGAIAYFTLGFFIFFDGIFLILPVSFLLAAVLATFGFFSFGLGTSKLIQMILHARQKKYTFLA